MPHRISYAQNGEDVRIWHAFGPRNPVEGTDLTYVEVGANEPRSLSVTAALYDLGWRGLLVEADPELAEGLRRERPGDVVIEAAAAAEKSELTFFRVPGTGLGTLDSSEAAEARSSGFEVSETQVVARPLDDILDEFTSSSQRRIIHALSIDVEGAEAHVLAGLSLKRHRPWVITIEAIVPGTHEPSHADWEQHVLDRGYQLVAFDGVNRWYVADEHAESPVGPNAGTSTALTIGEAIALPLNVLDSGVHGWQTSEWQMLHHRNNQGYVKDAWQRELLRHDLESTVPVAEYERQIDELRNALVAVEGSRFLTVSRKLARVGKKGASAALRLRAMVPKAVTRRAIKERHLRHVTVNMGHLTDSAFLSETIDSGPAWTASATTRPAIPPGVDPLSFTDHDAKQASVWLGENPFDTDEQLDSRMDNRNDEVGRARAALRTRIRLHAPGSPSTGEVGSRIAFDARSLQTAAFGERGIGRFAKAALLALRGEVGDERITLLVDRGLHRLPEALAGSCSQATHVAESEVPDFGLLIEPSPMTHSPEPVRSLLLSNVRTLAIVYDFIPLHFPSVYVADVATRLEYAANLDALARYSDFVCISQTVREELISRFSIPENKVTVAWPAAVRSKSSQANTPRPDSDVNPIVIMTGDDARKNTFGGLAGVAAATTDARVRDVVVVGMAGQDDRVHHWSIAAAMRPGEVQTAGRLSDSELATLLASAECVVVPSFDEGLSLPVIEASYVGIPVAASDIAPHRELLGSGAFLFDPRSPRSIAKAVQRTRGNGRTAKAQSERLEGKGYPSLEQVITTVARDVPGESLNSEGRARRTSPDRLNIGVATPWPPQRTGVGDYSHAVFTELAEVADLTFYTTADAKVTLDGVSQRSIEDVFDDPTAVQDRHDFVISVVGNSHYHLPFVQMLDVLDSIVVAHDTRMVEFYLALRDRGGLTTLMLTTADNPPPRALKPNLDDQIDDMRLLQNAGMWEIANRAQSLVMHSPTSASRIEEQTGTPVTVLPFAHYRNVPAGTITVQDREHARARLGLGDSPQGTIHLATFGYIDTRTKMVDVVVEAAAWLKQWGHQVALHLVGQANSQEEQALRAQATAAGLNDVNITGFQTEDQYQDWLLAIDVGIQLRVSPFMGVSGPLSDLAAYGTPAVASAGLCVDVDPPAFVHRLPDDVSPVVVAEAIEAVVRSPMTATEREVARQAYLEAKSPKRYAQLLLEHIREVVV